MQSHVLRFLIIKCMICVITDVFVEIESIYGVIHKI